MRKDETRIPDDHNLRWREDAIQEMIKRKSQNLKKDKV
jgi:hypothetical protein